MYNWICRFILFNTDNLTFIDSVSREKNIAYISENLAEAPRIQPILFEVMFLDLTLKGF